MSLSKLIVDLLKRAELFAYLPEPYNREMVARQRVRRFIRNNLWSQTDDD